MCVFSGGVGAERKAQGVAEYRMWRDAPDASGRLASFSGERRGSGVLPRSSWHVHRHCGNSAFCGGHFKL